MPGGGAHLDLVAYMRRTSVKVTPELTILITCLKHIAKGQYFTRLDGKEYIFSTTHCGFDHRLRTSSFFAGECAKTWQAGRAVSNQCRIVTSEINDAEKYLQ